MERMRQVAYGVLGHNFHSVSRMDHDEEGFYRIYLGHSFDPEELHNPPLGCIIHKEVLSYDTEREMHEFYIGFVQPNMAKGYLQFDYKKIIRDGNLVLPSYSGLQSIIDEEDFTEDDIELVRTEFESRIKKMFIEENLKKGEFRQQRIKQKAS